MWYFEYFLVDSRYPGRYNRPHMHTGRFKESHEHPMLLVYINIIRRFLVVSLWILELWAV